ncbi:MAG: 4-hydroxy-tetrahydrodipicolinate reductase [Bacteroidetes bacterium]|nr:4-hydroxy-tetrahydrodipicolinate reductase [Bacteroidota bacterium]
MKIALIGYGKLGKAIEEIALQKGHEIVLRVTKDNAHTYVLEGCDIAIECSNPEASFYNMTKCIEAHIPVVVGSTGWYHKFNDIKKSVEQHQGALLYATNFSIGVHLFWEANRALAKLMKKMKGYDVSITEIHHIAKMDAPSGTAITTAELLLEELETKKQWLLSSGSDLKRDENLLVHSIREGDAKGTHIVTYESAVDRIELKHEAFSRAGFARGAILAAEFLQNKKGVYSMHDVIMQL